MIKKISVILTVLVLLISTNVYAGDEPESIMLGKQKALFIGKIIDIGTNTYSILPVTVIMGNIKNSQIEIEKFYNYYGTDKEPKVDDFIVAKLMDENKVDSAWVFNCTSDDYKTLKLVSKPYDVVIRYEKYINEGTYFEAEKKILEKSQIVELSDTVSLDSSNNINSNKNLNFLYVTISISLSVLILGSIYVYTIKFKRIK